MFTFARQENVLVNIDKSVLLVYNIDKIRNLFAGGVKMIDWAKNIQEVEEERADLDARRELIYRVQKMQAESERLQKEITVLKLTVSKILLFNNSKL